MINKTITAALLVLMLSFFSPLAFGQTLGHKSSKSGFKSGQFKYPAGKKSHGSTGNTNLFNKHNEFHNKYYKPHPGTKAYNQKYYGNYGYGKKHYYKNQNKYYNYNYYGYRPYYKPRGYVYYGYNDYYPEDYYGYEEIPYDGYGSTLGTVPERRSNLDVNNYVYGPDYENYDTEYYPEDVYEYSDDYQATTDDYTYVPKPGNRTIYIWTDDRGVEHFVNDPNLIPEQFKGDLRIVEEY